MSNKGIGIKQCPQHGEYHADAPDSPCPACEDEPFWLEKHSVNCYFCNELFDEREGQNADEFNNSDGGSICPKCLQDKLENRNINEEIEQLLLKAGDKALFHVEKIARKILNANTKLDEFVMGMGSWSFTVEKNSDNYADDDNAFDELRDFISKWDKELCITGNPMRFTANGKKITDW